MPIKFACESCHQVLKVSSTKVGRRAKCPKCSEALTVPSAEAAKESLARRRRELDVTEEDAEDDDPFAEFLVYDDTELIYETEQPARRAADDRPVDYDRVAVPRIVLYMQGALLGVVALVFFTFGVIVGVGAGSGQRTEPVVAKCVVSGRVQYKNGANQKLPDEDAVVILLPQENKPEKQADPYGLRPGEPLPDENHQSLWTIREIGGAYARTDAKGEFKVRVDNSRKYYVLYISNKTTRRPEQEVTNKHVAEIGGYFLPVTDLLGENQYRWEVASIRGTQKRLADVVFE